jgi:hypothetical protein
MSRENWQDALCPQSRGSYIRRIANLTLHHWRGKKFRLHIPVMSVPVSRFLSFFFSFPFSLCLLCCLLDQGIEFRLSTRSPIFLYPASNLSSLLPMPFPNENPNCIGHPTPLLQHSAPIVPQRKQQNASSCTDTSCALISARIRVSYS